MIFDENWAVSCWLLSPRMLRDHFNASVTLNILTWYLFKRTTFQLFSWNLLIFNICLKCLVVQEKLWSSWCLCTQEVRFSSEYVLKSSLDVKNFILALSLMFYFGLSNIGQQWFTSYLDPFKKCPKNYHTTPSPNNSPNTEHPAKPMAKAANQTWKKHMIQDG